MFSPVEESDGGFFVSFFDGTFSPEPRSAEEIQLDVLKRMVLMHYPYDSFRSLEVEGNRLKVAALACVMVVMGNNGHANILGFYNLVDWTVEMNETNELTETGRCLRPQEYRGVLFTDMPHHPNSIFFFLFYGTGSRP